MSSCTVAQLAAVESLRLRVLVEGDRERRIRSVHVSDLEHPARYVLPGELLLTNGLWLDRVDPREWVRQARAAGVAAIGYGVGQTGPATPASVIEACDALQVALVEVPDDLPFSVIGECVTERNRNPDATVRLQLTRLRRLLQELARGEGDDAVLELVRRETRLPVWLVGAGGRSLAGGPAPGDVGRAAARAARRGDLPCALGPDMSAFGVADALSPTAFIVGAALADVSDDARLVLEQATAYLVLEDMRRAEREATRAEMAQEMLALADEGELGPRALDTRLRALGLAPASGLTVVAASGAERDLIYAARGTRARCVRTIYRGCTILLVDSDEDRVVDEIAELIRDGGADPVLGAGVSAGGTAGFRRALAEAVSAHELARGRPAGARVVRGLELSSYRELLEFVDPGVLRAFRERVIGPVQRWDEEHGSQLLQTLTAFFANDGHWRRTAAELHIHHNTLHYRLGKVATLTGRSIETVAARVDFMLALAIGCAGGPLPADHRDQPRAAAATVEPRR